MPVIYKDKVLGALSIGKKIDWLPEEIKKLTFHNSFLIYFNDDLKSLAPRYYDAFIKYKTKVSNYIFANSTNKEIRSSIVKKLDFSKKIQFCIVDNRLCIVNNYKLFDFKKHNLANIFTLYNANKFLFDAIKKIFANLFLMIVTAILVYLFFYGQISIDNLTGLYNIIKLEKELQKDVSVALINIKSFKSINEAFGFDKGNLIIKQVASELKHLSDYKVYRIGADEFALTTKDNNAKFENMDKILKQIENKINNKFAIEISLYCGISNNKDHKFETADMALRYSKDKNNKITIFNQGINLAQKERENIAILNKIKNGLKEDKFILYYQPIVDKNKEVIKYEALIRLKDGDDILSPCEFLPIAQKTTYYEEITRFVIKNAILRFNNRKELISINFSSDDFLSKKTINFLEEMYKYSKTNLVIELLENEAFDNPKIIETIKYLKSIGIKIAIDDFGKGYSNFSYLVDINPNYIKIDGGLIKNINKDIKTKKIVKSIIIFAKSMGSIPVAEFVSDEKIYKASKDLGIGEFQGYFFGKPKKCLGVRMFRGQG